MKNLKKALLILVVVVMALPACKKGKDDPSISLRSRKARLTGEWKLKEGTETDVSGGSSTVYTYTGSTCSFSVGGSSYTSAYSETITFDKKGTFEMVKTSGADLSTYKGSWYFGGKAKELDLKKKESVVLLITSSVETSGGTTTIGTYTGSDVQTITFNIDELKNKEMIVLLDGTSLEGSSTSNVTGTMTYEQ